MMFRFQADHIEGFADGNSKAAALADRVMDQALMTAEHPSIDMDDVAGLGSAWPQFLNDIRIGSVGNKADILTVGLIGTTRLKRSAMSRTSVFSRLPRGKRR